MDANMLAIFIIVTMLIIINCKISAQTSFGIKAGLNVTTLTNTDNLDSKIGANFGGVASIPLMLDLMLQPELFYSSQGFRRDFEGVREIAKIDYFNIPVLLDYHITDGLSLQAGPQLAINVRSEREIGGGIGENTPLFVSDVDFAAALGLQYFIDQSFFIQGRYTFGLTEVVQSQGQKHSVISLSLGFFFDATNASLNKGIDQ